MQCAGIRPRHAERLQDALGRRSARAAMRSAGRARLRRVEIAMRLARGLRAGTLQEAQGRCLARSLELCRQAQQAGVALQLVVWSVRADARYCDHWAAMLDEHCVIDPTRVQVDGSTRLMGSLRDYPANFLRPRAYPASLALPAFEAVRDHDHGRLPTTALFRIRWALLRHDLREVLACRDLARLLHGAVSLAKFSVLQTVHHWHRTLARRRAQLRERSCSPPLWARTTR